MKKITLFLLLCSLSVSFARIPEGYTLDSIPLPKGAVTVLGICQKDADTMAICTWEGEVWELKAGAWTLFAENLMEPNGIYYDQKEGCYYVAQKPELTRLIDTDQDGRADVYESYTSEFGHTSQYHEYHFGPVADSLGRKYASLNLAAATGFEVRDGRPGKGGMMTYTGPYRGWVYRSDRQGHFKPMASGFRSPAGIGLSPDDEVFITDNQGDWMPDCALFHVREGGFYGHPASLVARPDFDKEKVLGMTAKDFAEIRILPAVWLVRDQISNSPGSPIWDTTEGKFGSFKDQVFIGDQSLSNIIRCGLEEVDGDLQGFCINFLDKTSSGTIKMIFDDEGRLWTAQVGRGWKSKGGKRTALQTIEWDGKNTPFEMYSVSLTQKGFKVTFTEPLKELVTPVVSSWHYEYWSTYGSPRLDEKNHAVTNAVLSEDGLTLEFELPLEKEKVFEIAFPEMESAAGKKLGNRSAFYTLNKLRPAKERKRRVDRLLPGSGWEKNDGRRFQPSVVEPEPVEACSLERPANAIPLDKTAWNNPNWTTAQEGVLKRSKGNLISKETFGSSRIHIEFKTAPTDDPNVKGQLYGNSGIFLMSGYELQVMNSFENPTCADGMCGALWGQYPPRVNVSRRPGEWQSYDILMKAPEFSDAGDLLEPLRVTIFHNGVLIHDDASFLAQVNKPYEAHGRRPLMIQDHRGSDVFFRNMWIVPSIDYEKSLDSFRYAFSAPPSAAPRSEPITILDAATVMQLDANGDEEITEKEYVDFWAAQFDGSDADNNGTLIHAEFPYLEAFNAGDANKDGLLDRAEHTSIYRLQVKGLDVDGDGKITSKDKRK